MESVCYFNTFACPLTAFRLNGQCYTDVSHHGYSRESCNVIEGYYADGDCYYSGLCRGFAVNSQCYRYISSTYDCQSCRLVDGFFDDDGYCYYSHTCPYFPENDQCYRNQSTISHNVTCSSLGDSGSYYSRDDKCYFTPSVCSSLLYSVNCRCFLHYSSVYTADTCSNFGGNYSRGICYYNSSVCRFFALNRQCYRYFSTAFTESTCLRIGGRFYRLSKNSVPGCYYTTFHCRGYQGNNQCYGNRSLSYSRTTCQNIGGYYGFLYDNGPQLYCMFETFNCTGLVIMYNDLIV